MIGLSTWQSHSPLQQLKIDPVGQLGLPYWLAHSGCQRIFINIRGQYGIQKNIYVHPWARHYQDIPVQPYTLIVLDINSDKTQLLLIVGFRH